MKDLNEFFFLNFPDHSSSSLGLSFLSRIRESQRMPQSPLAHQPGVHDNRRDSNNKGRNDMW